MPDGFAAKNPDIDLDTLRQVIHYATDEQDIFYFTSKMGDGVALYALGGDDWVYGNWANNVIYGNAGDDHLWGGPGNDTVSGGDGDDFLYGDEGNDHVYGGADKDFMWGGDGDDTLGGGTGGDQLDGEKGNDLLIGGDGQDTLFGSDGNDHLIGGNDNDVLWGGTDADLLEGGAGADNFMFHTYDSIDIAGGTADTILDFDATDTIWIDGGSKGYYANAGDNQNPGTGEISVWSNVGGYDWIINFNDGFGVHQIIVQGADPHNHIHFI